MLANFHPTWSLIRSEFIMILGRQSMLGLAYESTMQAHAAIRTPNKVRGENEMLNRSPSKGELANFLSPERYLDFALTRAR